MLTKPNGHLDVHHQCVVWLDSPETCLILVQTWRHRDLTKLITRAVHHRPQLWTILVSPYGKERESESGLRDLILLQEKQINKKLAWLLVKKTMFSRSLSFAYSSHVLYRMPAASHESFLLHRCCEWLEAIMQRCVCIHTQREEREW